MNAKFRRRGGFTLVEMVWSLLALSFTLGGFFLLWSSIAKQQDISYTERLVDDYGNAVIADVNQDLRNAYGYNINKSGYFHSIDVYKVEYVNRNVDTLRVRWSVRPNGDAIRTVTRMNGGSSTAQENIRYKRFGNLIPSGKDEQMICRHFLIKTAFDMAREANEPDYEILDSSAVHIDLTIDFVKQYPKPTVSVGNEQPLTPTYMREFNWTSMVYLKNFYIRKHAEGQTQF